MLELKHLAPYLPYGLKVEYLFTTINGDVEERKALLIGINIRKEYFDIQLERIDKNGKLLINTFNENGKNIKPILRPLSDLTKEIEVNGEKFVPIVKLLEYQETNYFDDDKTHLIKPILKVISVEEQEYRKSKLAMVKYLVETTNMGDLVYSFAYSTNLRRFLSRNESQKRPLGTAYQLDMFNKLFEWHFDVFGLIDKGLAIDKTTLKP
jgi:hypothetical protein